MTIHSFFRNIAIKLPLIGEILSEKEYLDKELQKSKLEKESLNKELKKNKLEKESLDKEIYIKKDFDYLFLSPWTDSWKEYYLQNYSEFDTKKKLLKKNLDKKSANVIDTFLEKIIYQIPYNKYKKSFLYKKTDFYTKKEILEQDRNLNYKSEYVFPKNTSLESSVFLNENGFIFLDEDIRNNIKNSIVIDCGGYVGDSALVFSKYKPKMIYSFEPINKMYNIIKTVVKLNGKEQLIKPINVGLGDKEGKFAVYGEDSGTSMFSKLGEQTDEIEVTTIDSFFGDTKDKIGLIKLDVEGAESAVIEGAINIIKQHKPILLVSIYHRPEDFFDIKLMIEGLHLGYKFIVRKTSSYRVTSETVLICYI